MPYLIKQVAGEWLVIKRDTGKVVGKSKTKKDAEASIRARYAGEKMSEAAFEPPESGNAPKKVKDILASVYSSVRSAWVKDHPADPENAGNKISASKQAWAAVVNAGWSKNKEGLWVLKEEVWDGEKFVVKEGGPGSGNFGHSGRPGEIGGSGEGGSEGSSGTVKQVISITAKNSSIALHSIANKISKQAQVIWKEHAKIAKMLGENHPRALALMRKGDAVDAQANALREKAFALQKAGK